MLAVGRELEVEEDGKVARGASHGRHPVPAAPAAGEVAKVEDLARVRREQEALHVTALDPGPGDHRAADALALRHDRAGAGQEGGQDEASTWLFRARHVEPQAEYPAQTSRRPA